MKTCRNLFCKYKPRELYFIISFKKYKINVVYSLTGKC